MHDLRTSNRSPRGTRFCPNSISRHEFNSLLNLARTSVLGGGVRTQGRVTGAIVRAGAGVGAVARRAHAAKRRRLRRSRPTFSTRVDLVSVTAVVRDQRGRPVRNLGREDFRGLRAGPPAPHHRLQGERSGAGEPGDSLRRERQHARRRAARGRPSRGRAHSELGRAGPRRARAVLVRSRAAAGRAVHERSGARFARRSAS